MAKLKALKDPKDIAAVPISEPVLIQIDPPPSGREPDKPPPVEAKPEIQPPPKVEAPAAPADDDVAKLQKELKTLKAAEEKRTEEIARLTRERQEALRYAQDREREVHQSRGEVDRATSDHINSALLGAQSEQAAAKQEYAAFYNEQNPAGMADAQAKIGRAAAKILNYEAAAAEIAERQRHPPQQQPQPAPVDIVTAVQTNPGLLPKEREWLLAHQEVLVDQNRGKELEVAYIRATRAGHSRGTDAYFQYLDKELGYAKPQAETTESEEEGSIMAAPVSRDSGVPSGGGDNRVALTPEQREFARTLNLTDVQYATQVLKLQKDKKENPERYARG